MSSASPERRHLATGAAFSLATQGATIVGATITSVVIAHSVGPRGNGSFALVATIANVVTQLVALGLPTGITYFVSNRGWNAGAAMRQTQIAALTVGLAAAAIGTAITLAIPGLIAGLGDHALIAGFVAVPGLLSSTFAAAVALGEERYEAYGAIAVIQAALMTVIVSVLVITNGIPGAMTGFAAAQLTTAVAAVWIATPRAAERVGEHVSRLYDAVRFGIKAWVAELLSLLAYRFDLFILNAYAGRASVGVYSVAVSLTALGWVLPGALQTVLLPRVAGVHAEDETGTEGDVLAARAVRHTVVLLVPTVIVLAILLVVAIPILYGSDFRHAIGLGFLLIPGVAALGLAKVCNAITMARGYARYPMYTTLFVVPPTVIGYLVLIPTIEATGAAIVSSASYISATGLALFYFHRATRIPMRELIPRRSDFADYAIALRALRRLA